VNATEEKVISCFHRINADIFLVTRRVYVHINLTCSTLRMVIHYKCM